MSSVNRTTRSLAVRSISNLPSKIEYNKLKVSICFNCFGQSHLRKDCPSSNRFFKPNCGALHHTSLHVSDSGKSRHNVKKSCPDKPQAPTSTQTAENRPNTTNATPVIHLKGSHNNSRRPPFNPTQFNATVDPENIVSEETSCPTSSPSCVPTQWRQSF